MNYLDIILGALLLIGLIRGIIKGLFVELASLVAIIAGIYGAIRFSFYVSDFLQDKVDLSAQNLKLIAFAITFIGIILGVSLLGKLLTKVAKFAALGLINRVLGGAFGLLKFAIIASGVIMFLGPLNNSLGVVSTEVIEASVLYTPVEAIAPAVYPKIIEKYEEQKENIPKLNPQDPKSNTPSNTPKNTMEGMNGSA